MVGCTGDTGPQQKEEEVVFKVEDFADFNYLITGYLQVSHEAAQRDRREDDRDKRLQTGTRVHHQDTR